MKAREKTLAAIFLGLVFAFGGVLLGQRLAAWSKEIETGEESYRLAEIECRLMLEEENYWRQCAAWLSEKQPVVTSELEANQDLLNDLAKSAGRLGLQVARTQIEPVKHTQHSQQYGVTMNVKGSVPEVFRWINAQQSPESFCAVPMLKLSPDANETEKVVTQVQFLRWYRKPGE